VGHVIVQCMLPFGLTLQQFLRCFGLASAVNAALWWIADQVYSNRCLHLPSLQGHVRQAPTWHSTVEGSDLFKE
jgi:hypothetical protein